MKPNHIMVAAILAVILVMVSGCARTPEPAIQVKEVYIPVAQTVKPPEALYRGPIPMVDLPVFVSPSDPTASSCLAPPGEGKLRRLMVDREKRLDGWEKWIQ